MVDSVLKALWFKKKEFCLSTVLENVLKKFKYKHQNTGAQLK